MGQEGLVNVNDGDVTILENVGVATAIAAVANLCPAVSVQSVAALATLVAQNGGETNAFCTGTANGQSGPVTIEDAG